MGKSDYQPIDFFTTRRGLRGGLTFAIVNSFFERFTCLTETNPLNYLNS